MLAKDQQWPWKSPTEYNPKWADIGSCQHDERKKTKVINRRLYIRASTSGDERQYEDGITECSRAGTNGQGPLFWLQVNGNGTRYLYRAFSVGRFGTLPRWWSCCLKGFRYNLVVVVVEEYESWLKRGDGKFNLIMGTFDSGSIIIRRSNSHSIYSSACLEGYLQVDGYKYASSNQI